MRSPLPFLISWLVILGPLAVKLKTGDNEDAAITAAILIGAALLFLVSHIIKTGAWKDALGNLVIVVLLTVGSLIPLVQFVCIPLLIIFFLYNLVQTLETIKQIRWHIATCVVLFLCVARAKEVSDFASLLYLAASFRFASRNVNKSLYETLLDLSILAVSVPLTAMLIAAIASSFRALFSFSTTVTSSSTKVAQAVSAHVRAGVPIAEYTREVTKLVPATITSASVGTGAIGASAAQAASLLATEQAVVEDEPPANTPRP